MVFSKPLNIKRFTVNCMSPFMELDQGKPVKSSIRLYPDTWDTLEMYRTLTGKSNARIVAEALQNWIENKGGTKGLPKVPYK